MAFELSYGGVKIGIPREAEMRLLEKYAYFEGLEIATQPRQWYGPNVRRLPLPIYPKAMQYHPGCFHYPTGASRWSWFSGLVTEEDKNTIVNKAFVSTSPNQPAVPTSLPFVIKADDKTHTDNSSGMKTNMLALPPRPLGQTKSDFDGLYLLTLVDERYLFQFNNAGTWHTAQLTSWSNLVNLLATALGVTINTDAIAATYLTPEPDSDLYQNYESAAVLLDAVAWNIGMTVVRNLDGTYHLKRFNTADPPILTKLATNYSQRPAANLYRTFGGDMIDPNWKGVGLGPNAPQSPAWNMVLPKSVTVTFPKFQNGSYYDPNRAGFFTLDSYGDVYPIVVTLASLGAPYNLFTGFNGTKVIQDTCKACFSVSQNPATDTPTNSGTVLQPLAQQLAMDYYDLHLNGADEVYAGIRHWLPDPVNDLCYYFQGDDDHVYTRVTRKPWNFGVTMMQHSCTCS